MTSRNKIDKKNKSVTDRPTDGRTDKAGCRVACNVRPRDLLSYFPISFSVELYLSSSHFQDLLYNLFPLVAGNVTLPRLNVSMTRYPNLAIAEIVHKLIPSQIFVIPAKKDGGLASLSVDAKPTLIDAPLTDVAS